MAHHVPKFARSGPARRLPLSPRAMLGLGVVVALALAWWLWRSPGVDVVGKPLGEGRPVLILLHGYGGERAELVPFARRLVSQLPDLTVVLPDAPHPGGRGRAWIGGQTAQTAREHRDDSREWIRELIDDAIAATGDARHVYVGGFSQGGQASLDVVARSPDLPIIGGVAVLSGKPPFNMAPDSDEPLRAGRFFVAHGTGDRTIPLPEARFMKAWLERLGHELHYVEFQGGHDVGPQTQQGLVQFLSRHR